MTDADDRVAQALENLKRLERENKTLRQQLILAQASGPAAEGDDGAERKSFGECTAVAKVVEGVGGKDLRVLGDQMRDQLGRGATLLISKNEGGKVALLVAVSKAESDQMHAGKTVQAIAPLVGGRGGGRPDFAQAGGDDASGIDKAVKAFFEAASSAFSS